MDTQLIAEAPVRLLVAGIGDALATYYEAASCQRSNALTMLGGHTTKTAMALAELCKETLLEDGLKAVMAARQGVCTAAVENIIEANTYLSGIGFESGGLSAAHAVHNGLTVLEESHGALHGEKVAFGVITQLVLENYPLYEIQEIVEFCKSVGLPVTFDRLGLGGLPDDQLLEAARRSCDAQDTMSNLGFEVDAYDVMAAMKTADALGSALS